jgi:hypothetical protein
MRRQRSQAAAAAAGSSSIRSSSKPCHLRQTLSHAAQQGCGDSSTATCAAASYASQHSTGVWQFVWVLGLPLCLLGCRSSFVQSSKGQPLVQRMCRSCLATKVHLEPCQAQQQQPQQQQQPAAATPALPASVPRTHCTLLLLTTLQLAGLHGHTCQAGSPAAPAPAAAPSVTHSAMQGVTRITQCKGDSNHKVRCDAHGTHGTHCLLLDSRAQSAAAIQGHAQQGEGHSHKHSRALAVS